jgi:hypothetical protein
MAAKRVRMDRRLPVAPKGHEVTFRDAWGETRKHYDLGKLPLPADITGLLREAFAGHYAASEAETLRHCWHALKVFARFVASDGEVLAAADLTTSMVGRYTGWLDAQVTRLGEPWRPAVKANQLTWLRQLIDWTKRHHAERLPARIDFPNNPYPNRPPRLRPQLGAPQLKAILRACYEEIDAAWTRFQTGQAILASDGPIEGVDPELCRCVRMAAAVGGGVAPSALEMKAHGCPLAMLDRHGGLRVVGSYLHLSMERLAPFFIAITIQTAGNPDALRRLRRDCQVPHPLDEYRVMIDWGKSRAGIKRKRAQRRSFDRRRQYAAPNLIDRVLQMTEPMRAHARPQDRDLLFLSKSEKKNQVVEVPMGTLSKSVKRFVARANVRIEIWNEAAPERRRDMLPDFAAAFIRGSVAIEHYKASGGDILEAQTLLNHAHTHTTDIYVRGPEVRRLQAETISRLQQLMLAWVKGTDVRAPDAQNTSCAPATVPFGHDCLNPIGGVATGSEIGQLCPWFGGCLRCPGLVIPLDAVHLARLLQARATLESGRERIDPKRWAMLYAPSYRVLVDEILPDFAGALYGEAHVLMAALPQLPALE